MKRINLPDLWMLAVLSWMLLNQNVSAQNLIWAQNLGGTEDDIGYSIAIGDSGSVYVAGSFKGTADFDPGAGVANLTAAGAIDCYLAKYDSLGNYLWAFGLGASSNDIGLELTVDQAGNAYLTGQFGGTIDFDPDTGVVNLTSAGGTDIFLAKYSASGQYVWANRMGGSGADVGNKVVLDASEGIYLIGNFSGTADFDPGAGVANQTSAGSTDIFIAKYNTTTGSYYWANRIGATGMDFGRAMVVDADGNLVLAGYFNFTVDFDPGPNVANLVSAGGFDAFLAKYDASGNYIWAKGIGGISSDMGLNVAVDQWTNVYLTGIFYGEADFNPGTGVVNLTPAGASDIYVAKYSPAGNYVWAKSMPGTEADYGWTVAVNALGNVFLTGSFTGTVDFNPGAGVANLVSAGGEDIFLAKYDSLGNYLWAKRMGGPGTDQGYKMELSSSGGIYLTGQFNGTVDFEPGAGLSNLAGAGGREIYMAQFREPQRDLGAEEPGQFVGLPAPGSTSAVSLIIYNNGLTTINAADVGYQVDNNPPVTGSWTGALGQGQSDTFTFITPVVVPNQHFTLRRWVVNPNNAGPDSDLTNDTLTVQMCSSLAGNYTVGGPNADFSTLQQALEALICGGLRAPASFELSPGHYGGGYVVSAYPGMSLYPFTIRSQSGNAADVVFGSMTAGASIKLLGVSNFKLRDVTISDSLAPAAVREALLVQDCSNLEITGCIMQGTQASTSANNRLLRVTGSADSIGIKGNTFSDGYYGVFSDGPGDRSNLHISGNTLLRIYHTPFHLQGSSVTGQTNGYVVDGNLIDNSNMTAVHPNGYGINFNGATNFSISNNRWLGKLGVAALYLANFSGDSLHPNRVFNNVCNVSFTSFAPKMVHFMSSASGGMDYVELHHNSFLLWADSLNAVPNGAFFVQGGSSQQLAIDKISFKNNVLLVIPINSSGATPATFRSWHLENNNQLVALQCNYNDYYNPSATEFLFVNNPPQVVATLAAWQTGFGQDNNSLQSDPFFSTNDLFPSTGSPLVLSGTPIAGISRDINGFLRHLTTPTIGAYEVCQLSVNQTSAQICAGSSYSFGTQLLTASGTYNHTFSASNGGCDSMVTLALTVLPPDSTQIAATICQGDIYVFGSQSLTSAGVYHHTFSTSAGCDSVVRLTLHVNTLLTSNVSAAVCPGSSYNFGGQSLGAAGTYRDTLSSANGCDSVVTLTLTVSQAHQVSASAAICQGSTYAFGSQLLSSPGTYSNTFQNSFGCDSVVTLTLTVNPNQLVHATAGICPGGSYTFGPQILQAAGTYNHTFQNVFGCDSAVTLTLSIDTSLAPTGNQFVSICMGDSYPFAGQLLTTAGTYTALVPGSACDSLITLHLDVTTVDTSLTVSGFTLTANATNATYKWLDCANGLPVPGVTAGSITVTANGSYAVIVNQNGCIDTSDCYTFTTVGLNKIPDLKVMRLYPNPSNGLAYLILEMENTNMGSIRIYDLKGRVVYDQILHQTEGKTTIELQLQDLAEGVYSLVFQAGERLQVSRLLLMKSQ